MTRLWIIAPALLVLACSDSAAGDEADTNTNADAGSDSTASDTGEGCVPLPAEIVPASTDLTLSTADGKQLAATVTRPGAATCRPGLLLLHQFGLDRRQWDAQLPAFVAAGYVVLTVDLRGHGQSDPADGALVDLLEDPEQAPLDVDAALAALAGHEAVDAERLAIVGTSIGANLAVVAMHQHPEVDLAVPISPRMTPLLNLASNPASLQLRPLFCLAGALDSSGEQAQTCEDLLAQAGGASMLRILPDTAAHGVDIVDGFPETVPDAITWLDASL